MTLADLHRSGFELRAVWTKTDASFHKSMPKTPGVYMFVVRGEVKYVGCTIDKNLRHRMRWYSRHQGRYPWPKKLRKVHGAIHATLDTGEPIEVWTFSPQQIEWNGLPVNLVAGIEVALISELRPEWNHRGVTALEGP